jgi:asparagine synthase (glutamine-hydrolysing)
VGGICGIIDFGGAAAEPEALRKMAQAAAHRGPDGVRYWTKGEAGLANLALNITPESAREQQPLVSKRGDVVLTADARIDNREELIHTLHAKGHLQGKAPTDAEVILSAYRFWETDCAAQLVGDFAFAVWDARKRRLFAARDPMAMRAFYYRVEPRRVLFGTEAKQILAAPNVPMRIFEPAVAAHLAGPFVLPEWSFYEGVSQLPAAHALVVDEKGWRTWRYWDVEPGYRLEYADEEDYVEHFTEIFVEAVRCRLRSAKPVGLFLSGGMDSGSIASVAGWLMRRDKQAVLPSFRAYSSAFEELRQCDERHISEGIARHYGFPVTDVPADDAWPLKDYPDHGPDMDDPLIWPYETLIERTLSAARSQGMGLVLSGSRGDEMVGDWVFDYLSLLRTCRWRALQNELQERSRQATETTARTTVRELLKPLLLERWPRQMGWVLQKRHQLRHSEEPSPYPQWVRPEFAQRVGLEEIVEASQPRPTMSESARRARYARIFSFASSRLVSLDERTRARFGIGFADPWSDQRLASFVLATPQWRIQRVGKPKRIARLAMRGIMPEGVRQSAGKIIPAPLYERGLRERAGSTILDLITNSQAAAQGYIDDDALRNSYRSICKGEAVFPAFWEALTLEMWLRRYWK